MPSATPPIPADWRSMTSATIRSPMPPSSAPLAWIGSSQASVFSSKKIFKFGVIESKMLTSVERGRITRRGRRKRRQPCDVISCAPARSRWHLSAASALPPPNSSRHRTPARRRTRYSSTAPSRFRARPANTDTVPAKFSVKNAADDKLIIIAYTFKTLSDEERRAIYQALKGQPAAAFNADVGTELPPGVELHPVPNEVAARVPQTRGYRYVVANDRVLLVGTSRIVVGVFADANAR